MGDNNENRGIEKFNSDVNHVLYTDSGEPETYQEAVADESRFKWEQAMKDEMDSLEEKKTRELVERTADMKVLYNRWVYKVSTRSDIGHAVGVVSKYMQNPGNVHWEAVKWILRYLRGTSKYSLCFGGSDINVNGYVDSDHAGSKDDGKSTDGYVFTVGGTTVSWLSRLQKVVALSTTEAEYIAATEASKEIIWLQRLMERLGKNVSSKLWSDSQSAIHLAKNSAFHSRTKYIQLRYHFIRSLVEEGKLNLVKIDGSRNPADMLTKVVDRLKLSLCSTSVNLK